MAESARALGNAQSGFRPQLLDEPAPEPQALVIAILEGDVVAFEDLFHSLYPPLLRYVTQRTGSRAIAEELVQDVFVEIWRRRRTLDPARPVRSYIFRSARNAIANHGRRQRLDRRLRDWLLSRPGRTAQGQDRAATDELATAIAQAVKALPPRCREVFTLSREGRLSHAEIAATLGLSTKTVENHMGRALKRLRESLRPFMD
jgi:RNA polymerase sigma-70 factor (ECF subfamily)